MTCLEQIAQAAGVDLFWGFGDTSACEATEFEAELRRRVCSSPDGLEEAFSEREAVQGWIHGGIVE